MAEPLSSTRMMSALRSGGLRPVGLPGWTAHNRNHKGPWGPVHGVVIHHTAGVSKGLKDYVWGGSSALPGPLCHAFLAKDATLYLIGHGRTNHAGRFAENAHAAVRAEAAVHPRPDAVETVDGNRHYYGLEIENRGDGKDPYPPAQYRAAVRWAAAICLAHGWTEHSVIGHSEGTRRKIDPSFDMNLFRRSVAAQLRALHSGTQTVENLSTPGAFALQYTALSMTDAPETVPAGASRIIYWDAEQADEPGDHGNGGKTILSGATYSGTVGLRFAAPVPPGVRVHMIQELAGGNVSGEPVTDLAAGPTLFDVSVTGRVPEDRNLCFNVVNGSDVPVTLAWATVRLFSQPAA